MTRAPRTLKAPRGSSVFIAAAGLERVHELAVDLDLDHAAVLGGAGPELVQAAAGAECRRGRQAQHLAAEAPFGPGLGPVIAAAPVELEAAPEHRRRAVGVELEHVLVSALDLSAQGFIQRTKAEKGQCWYLCQDAHGQQAPIRATDWKAAKADGWEKIYNFKDGRRLTMKQAKAEGLGTKDRTSKRPVQMHRISGQAARDVGSAELTAVRSAWAEIANRHLAAHAAATGTTAQVIDHRSNKDRGLDEQPTVHEGGTGLIGHADRVKLNKEIRDRNARLRVLRAELQQEGAALEQLQREVAELERQRGRIEKAKRGRAQGRHRGALAKRRRVAMATAAADADAQRRVAMATADQVDTRAEMIAQLDEQIAALDLKIRQLQGGNSAAMLSGPLLKAAGLGIERRKLADERARLAGEDPAPRKPEPPQAEQKRPRGHKH